VVPGVVSPAQTPHPAMFPFRSAPGPRTSGGRVQTAPLPSILEGDVGYPPSSSPSRGRLPSTFHVPSTACLPRSRLFDSIAGGLQPPRRGGSSSREGGHRGGSAASSSSQLRKQHLLGEEEEWEDAARHQPQEAECSAPGDPSFPDGIAPGCPPRHLPWGLGGFHRLKGRIFPCSHPCCGQEIPSLWLERPPVPVLHPPLRSVTSSLHFHSSHKEDQGKVGSSRYTTLDTKNATLLNCCFAAPCE
jgi:hypothetical protein